MAADPMKLPLEELLYLRLGDFLDQLHGRKVEVAARHGNLRVSPHFYNDETDLERFEQELKLVLA